MARKILLTGDSLIEFFDWQARFPDHHVWNLGMAGETVEGLLMRMDRIIDYVAAPDRIFVMTGINNVAMDDLGFLGAYRRVIARLSASFPQAEIYVHSLLPTMLDWVSNRAIQGLNEKIGEMARETGAVFVNLYTHFVDSSGEPIEAYLLPDGVHLSAQGYAEWSAVVEEIINR